MSISYSKLVAKFRLVTPMFCSAADTDVAELRLPSIKGLLRFWWRVSQAGVYSEPGELLKRENEVFGSTECQSKVILRLIEKNLAPAKSTGTVFGDGRLKGAYYLAYGCLHAYRNRNKQYEAGELTRSMIAGGDFALEMRLPKAFLHEVACSVKLLGCFGGVGSKSRKGYGSISLVSMEIDGASKEVGLSKAIDSMPKTPENIPVWTAVSRSSRLIECYSPAGDSVNLLDQLGRELVHYRSWGKEGRVLGKESEHRFEADHHLHQYPCKASINHPKRVVFGLPHNYGKNKTDFVNAENYNRRASPMLFSIYQPDSDQPPKAHVLFMPSKFLPDGQKLVSFGRKVSVMDSDPESFWSPINGFLDRLISPNDDDRKTPIRGREVQIG